MKEEFQIVKPGPDEDALKDGILGAIDTYLEKHPKGESIHPILNCLTWAIALITQKHDLNEAADYMTKLYLAHSMAVRMAAEAHQERN